MATNSQRPTITYENIALVQSDTPCHTTAANSGDSLSFLPQVEAVSFIELLQIYLHRNCLSWRFTADRPRRALLFVLLSIKPEDQQTHD